MVVLVLAGHLFKLSKEVTRAAVERMKLQKMEEKGIGDFETEIEAIRKMEDSRNGKGRMDPYGRSTSAPGS